MEAGADTNDPAAYYDWGARQLRNDPAASAAAFDWTGRLNPENAMYPYARRTALIFWWTRDGC